MGWIAQGIYGLAALAAQPQDPNVVVDVNLLLRNLINVTVFTALGLVMFGIAFWIMVKVAPFCVKKEIEEDQNTALGIVMGSVILGIAIIIGAIMAS
jgi:putative membrane protein